MMIQLYPLLESILLVLNPSSKTLHQFNTAIYINIIIDKKFSQNYLKKPIKKSKIETIAP